VSGFVGALDIKNDQHYTHGMKMDWFSHEIKDDNAVVQVHPSVQDGKVVLYITGKHGTAFADMTLENVEATAIALLDTAIRMRTATLNQAANARKD
jgi:hypothetical protein